MEEILNQSYLGRGWSFPPTFIKGNQQVELVAEETDIEQSLHLLLATRPGERIMQPDYGCNLDVLLFEPLTTTLITYVKDIINTAVVFHEPRINVNSIQIEPQPDQQGLLLLKVDYTIRTTNSRFNFVYPFYLEEATNL